MNENDREEAVSAASEGRVAEVLVGLADDGEPVVLSASERLAHWIGRPLDRVKGLPLSAMMGDAVPGLLPAVRLAMAGGRPAELRFRFTGPDGREQDVSIRVLRPEAFERRGLSGMVVVRMEKHGIGGRDDAVMPFAAFHGLVGQSPAMLNVFRKIRAYGPTDASVIVTGETGTGKELVARALHAESRRRRGAFVAVNCTAISKELLESELFGHERGSFTGAVRTHRGRFERASGGTLFLDEIGDMPPPTQAKLLRVLQEKRIERVGGDRALEVDVRVVSATNVPLEQAVADGVFRQDLFHRLAVLRIHLPPLNQRGSDLERIAQGFIETFNRTYDRDVVRLTPGALELLYRYHWPGNVRELRNVIERVFIETRSNLIGRRAFEEWVAERQAVAPGAWSVASLEARRASEPPIIVPPGRSTPLLPAPAPFGGSGPRSLDEAVLTEAFRAAGGNITEAARRLGIHKATFYRRMKALGLDRDSLAGSDG